MKRYEIKLIRTIVADTKMHINFSNISICIISCVKQNKKNEEKTLKKQFKKE